MSENTNQGLSGVAETLLMTVYIRAMESQRPDALIKDEKAVALVTSMSYDFDRIRQLKMDDDDKVGVILRNREFDRFVQDFLTRNPEAVVVHIGCGLDSRFERVDNGQVEWYDLDLPDVIDLRWKLVGGEGGRYHLLGCSVLDDAWLEAVSAHPQRPFLFLAEGVFMYFEEAQVKSLVLTLRDRLPGAELVFDAFSPFLRRVHNNKVTRTGIGAHLHWALKRPQDLERWSDGIRLLDERFPFRYPEPRMRRSLFVLLIPFLAKAFGVFHYQL